jgi:hypothetical protein
MPLLGLFSFYFQDQLGGFSDEEIIVLHNSLPTADGEAF